MREKPVVPENLVWFWNAYWDLDTCRTYGGEFPRPIPWTIIKQYAEQHEIEFDYLHSVISEMDETYLKYKAEQYNQKMDEIRNKGNRYNRNKGDGNAN